MTTVAVARKIASRRPLSLGLAGIALAAAGLASEPAVARGPRAALEPVSASSPRQGAPALGGVLYCDEPVDADYGLLSQDYPDYPTASSRTLDDFEVPPGRAWVIDAIRVEGFFNGDPPDPSWILSYFFELYLDSEAGGPVCDKPFYSVRPRPGDPGMTDGPNALGQPRGALEFRPPGGAGLRLPPGKYWLSAGVEMSSELPVSYYWLGSRSPHVSGSIAYFHNPGGYYGLPPCAPVSILPADPQADQDQAFKLFGSIRSHAEPTYSFAPGRSKTKTFAATKPAAFDLAYVAGDCSVRVRLLAADGSVVASADLAEGRRVFFESPDTRVSAAIVTVGSEGTGGAVLRLISIRDYPYLAAERSVLGRCNKFGSWTRPQRDNRARTFTWTNHANPSDHQHCELSVLVTLTDGQVFQFGVPPGSTRDHDELALRFAIASWSAECVPEEGKECHWNYSVDTKP